MTLEELITSNTNPDVLCFSETFLTSAHKSYVNVAHYELASAYSRDQQRGGTCILIKPDFIYEELNFLKNHATQKIFEVCGINIPSLKMLIICIYRIPKSDPNLFLNKLDVLLNDIHRRYKKDTKIVITGDFNIDTLRPGKYSTYLTDLCNNHNLKLHINTPTRKKSCIDHILSNIKDATATVLPLYLSDHETAQLLSFAIKETIKIPKFHFIFKRDYCFENINKFKDCVKNLSWSEVYDEFDPNVAFQKFHDTLTLFYNLCFPNLKIKINNTKTKKQKWISRGLKISCKTKRGLRFRYYNDKSATNKEKYLNYSKLLKKCIYNSQKKSNIKFINHSKNKCKAAWTVIKSEIANNTIDDDIEMLKINNDTLTHPTDIATAFNKYYIGASNTGSTKALKHNPKSATLANTIYLEPMTVEEVKKEIMSLNNTAAEGYDNISTKIIKVCVTKLAPIVTYLINLSFAAGVFPDKLKLSLVKPLYKKGDKENPVNYRPITLIPILSKVFEKCMLKRLMNFCTKFNIIKKEQFGFQKEKSTTLAIFNLINNILTNLNKDYLTTGLFIDLSKAFDFVSHEILLKKLEFLGIRGPTLAWIESYISGRQQKVVINKIIENKKITFSSEFEENDAGVPQGSVLGPILFLLYINDITDITNHKCTLYADDISIIVTSNNSKCNDAIRKHELEVNRTIDIIIDWLKANNLNINLDKSYFIQFNKSKHKQYNFALNVPKMNESHYLKFLGITIDEDLDWKKHVNELCAKINKFVYALRRVRNVTDKKTAIVSYRAYIESILRYGIILWGNSTEKNRAFIAQKKCIRAICGVLPDVSCKGLFKSLGLLPLPSLYVYEVAVFVHKNTNLFKKVNNYRLRDPHRMIFDNIPKSDKYAKSCLCMCVRVYNKIPKELKMLNIYMFKQKLYEWINQNNFYDINSFFNKNN